MAVLFYVFLNMLAAFMLYGFPKHKKLIMDRNLILQALSRVKDPVSGRGLVEQNMIKSLTVDDQVHLVLQVGDLNMDKKNELNFSAMGAIHEVYPDANVNLHMVVIDQSQQVKYPHLKNIIAVASGKGGVGKSTISVNLAIALKEQGYSVGILDADVYGPSIPIMMGLKGKKPMIQDVHGRPMMIPLEAYGIPVMSLGFIIEPEQAVVLRGPKLSTIVQQFFNECVWPELDYLIVDLPPGTGDVQLTLVQTAPVTGVVMVTTPQDVAVADALKGMNMFRLDNVKVPILGVIENMSWFTPVELPDNKYFIFGQGGGQRLAEMGDTRLLGQVPIVMGIRESGDEGKPAALHSDLKAPFTFLAGQLTQAVERRTEQGAPTTIVKITT